MRVMPPGGQLVVLRFLQVQCQDVLLCGGRSVALCGTLSTACVIAVGDHDADALVQDLKTSHMWGPVRSTFSHISPLNRNNPFCR